MKALRTLLAIGCLAILALPAIARTTLTGAVTLYVTTTGVDGNDCLTPATACRTKQYVSDMIQRTYDLACNKVTVQSAPGAYSDPLEVKGPYVGACGPDAVTFKGGLTDWAYTETTQAVVNPNAFWARHGAVFVVDGFYCTATGDGVQTGFCLLSDQGYIRFGMMNFGAVSAAHIDAGGNASFIQGPIGGWYVISGDSNFHAIAEALGVIALNGTTIVTVPAVTYRGAFAQCDQGAALIFAGSSFAGYSYSSNGRKFNAISNCVIDTNMQSDGWLPGNQPGTRSLGGVYY